MALRQLITTRWIIIFRTQLHPSLSSDSQGRNSSAPVLPTLKPALENPGIVQTEIIGTEQWPVFDRLAFLTSAYSSDEEVPQHWLPQSSDLPQSCQVAMNVMQRYQSKDKRSNKQQQTAKFWNADYMTEEEIIFCLQLKAWNGLFWTE